MWKKIAGTAAPSWDGDRDSKGAWRAPGSRIVPGVMLFCATPGKREPTLLRGGPLAPWEPRLVFQSRRAGIFSVQQISLMAQRWSRGTLGTLARWQLQGGGFPGGHSLGRQHPQSLLLEQQEKHFHWNGRENYVELEICS